MSTRLITLSLAVFLAVALALIGCESDSGEVASGSTTPGALAVDHGGITEVPTDPALVEEGKKLFAAKGCSACHQMEAKVVGPPLGDVTERRDIPWVAAMIMHPEEMVKKDPIAKALLDEYKTPMPNQNITAEEAKAIIAFLGN